MNKTFKSFLSPEDWGEFFDGVDILRRIAKNLGNDKGDVILYVELLRRIADSIDRISTIIRRREVNDYLAFQKQQPELYEALQEAVAQACGGHGCEACRNEPDKCFVKRWIKVLAKARGGQETTNTEMVK